MKQKINQTLFAYWNAVRRDRMAPRRFEIEPARIADILPDTFILEATSADAFRFRLAGTRMCEMFGTELRGSDFLAGWTAHDRTRILECLRTSIERGGVTLLTVEANSERGHITGFELLILPLVHTNNTIDRLVGAIAATDHPHWLGEEPLTKRTLLHADTIWPEGRPHSVVEKLHHQSPFLPHIRSSRIVRSDRRQFRVYDGGLTKDERGER